MAQKPDAFAFSYKGNDSLSKAVNNNKMCRNGLDHRKTSFTVVKKKL